MPTVSEESQSGVLVAPSVVAVATRRIRRSNNSCAPNADPRGRGPRAVETVRGNRDTAFRQPRRRGAGCGSSRVKPQGSHLTFAANRYHRQREGEDESEKQ